MGGNLFQMELLNYFRTGNPVTDALLFSFLTFLVSTIVDNYYNSSRVFLDSIKKFFRTSHDIEFVVESLQPSVGIESYNGDDKVKREPNTLYHAIAWFINEKDCVLADANSYKVVTLCDDYDQYDTGNYEEGQTPQSECIFIPTSDIQFLWKGEIIFGSHSSVTDRQGEEKGSKIVLSMTSVNAKTLEQFCQTVLNEFEEHEKAKKVGQRMYGLSASSGYGNKVMWTGKPFSPRIDISSVILRDNLQQKIELEIEKFLTSKDIYARNGMLWKRGFLFYGPPGTGKTSMVKAIAAKTKFNVYSVKLARFQTDMDMEANLRKIPPKSIVLFEDIDCMTNIAHSRAEIEDEEDSDEEDPGDEETSTGNGTVPAPPNNPATPKSLKKEPLKPNKPTLNTLLNFVDGVDSPEGILIIMTTNHIEKLDPALLRDGRIDARYKLEYCSRRQISDLSEKFFGISITHDQLSDIPDNMLSPATVTRIMMDVSFYAYESPVIKVLDRLKSELLERKNESCKNTEQVEQPKEGNIELIGQRFIQRTIDNYLIKIE